MRWPGCAISRVIVTHAHPDHLGLAGWMVQRFHCPLYMSQIEYLHGVYHQHRKTEERVAELAAVLPPPRHG